MKHDSQFCAACGEEFTRSLVEMVRQRVAVCDSCLEEFEEDVRRAKERLAGGSEGVGQAGKKKGPYGPF
jgi:hypothetical protein